MNRCLIVERHPYETGKDQKQPQIPAAAFKAFFSTGGQIQIHLFRDGQPVRAGTALASAYTKSKSGKRASETYRLQSIKEFKNLPSGFIFVEEVQGASGALSHYDVWFRKDKAGVLNDLIPAHGAFNVAPKGKMPSRGRLYKIVNAPVSKTLGNE